MFCRETSNTDKVIFVLTTLCEYENSIVKHRIRVDSCQGGDPENEII